MPRPRTVLLIATGLTAGTLACSSPDGEASDGQTTTTMATTTVGSSASDTSTASDSATTGAETETETETETGGTEASTTDPTVGFVGGNDDWGGEWGDCDSFAQDCPEGEKCVPYASAGESYDGDKCVPITGSDKTGEACVYSSPVEAVDSCDADGVCWFVEAANNELVGVCTGFCMGTVDNPLCPDGETCMIANDGSITLCIDACDPILLDDCGPDYGCYWIGDDFACLPAGDSLLGAECDNFNGCGPGNLCVSAAAVPECIGAACCVQLCSLANPNCDQAGTDCVAFFEDPPPPEYADLGVCL